MVGYKNESESGSSCGSLSSQFQWKRVLRKPVGYNGKRPLLKPSLDLSHEECAGPRKQCSTTFFFKEAKTFKSKIHPFSHPSRLSLKHKLKTYTNKSRDSKWEHHLYEHLFLWSSTGTTFTYSLNAQLCAFMLWVALLYDFHGRHGIMYVLYSV